MKTKTLAIIGAIIGWSAVSLQFYLIIVNRIAPVPETIVRFFSYFTILTNIIAALAYTFIWLKPDSKWGRFFSKPQTLSAITVYIAVVGIVYNTILRFIWEPHGSAMVADELLHSVAPVFFFLYWLFRVPKITLQWEDLLPWLIYPLVYLVYIVIHGACSGFYPYPFINVNKLGYQAVFTNSIFLAVVFLLASVVLIGFAKWRSRRNE